MTETAAVPVNLPILQWGTADAPHRVLLVHGLSANANGWWRVAAELAQGGCHVVAPDLRGHGGAPRATTYRLLDQAADLHVLGVGWHVAVGHSLGGAIVATAAQRAGFADAAVLLDPVLAINENDLDTVVADQLAELDPDADPAAILAAHPRWDPEDAFQKAMAARTTSTTVVERCLLDNRPWAHLDLVDRATVSRTLVLGADPDIGSMFPPELGRGLSAVAVEYRMCDGVGHGIHREAPELVVEAVRELLS